MGEVRIECKPHAELKPLLSRNEDSAGPDCADAIVLQPSCSTVMVFYFVVGVSGEG